MTSPLLTYSNAWLLITQQGTPTISNGRVTTSAGNTYLVECYLARQQSRGTDTGADYTKTGAQGTKGASGQVYLYRGYALRYGAVSSGYDLSVLNLSGITFQEFTSNNKPEWLKDGVSGLYRHGNEKPAYFAIENSAGRFGNAGIDEIINTSIGGLQLIIRSGQVIN